MLKKYIKTGLKTTIVIILIISLIFGGVYMMKQAKIKNVFDEMFYVPERVDLISPTTKTKYGGKYTDGPTRDDYFDWPYLTINYKQKTYQNWDLYGWFTLNDEEKKIDFEFGVILNENPRFVISHSYTYFVKEEELLLKPISFASAEKKNLTGSRFGKTEEEWEPYIEKYGITKDFLREINDYFLYDIMIGTWIESNEGKTLFTLENPGEFEIEDKRFEFLGNLRETEEE